MLFSGKAVLIKFAYADGADAETLIALRMLMAFPMFYSIYWWHSRKRSMSPLSWLDRGKLIGLGFLGYFLSSYVDFLGLQYISVNCRQFRSTT